MTSVPFDRRVGELLLTYAHRVVARGYVHNSLGNIAIRARTRDSTTAWSTRARRGLLAVAAFGLVVAVGSAAWEDKGLMRKAGEEIDRATDQDKVIGKGPLEKAGKNVDDAAKDLKQ